MDLRNIQDYIARDSEFYAVEFVEGVFEVIENLSEFPNIGRMVLEFQDQKIREIIYYNYRIIYRLDNKKVEVLTIVHGSRELKNLNSNS